MLKILLPSGGEIAYKRAGEAFRDMWQAVTGSLPELLCESEYSGEGDDLVLIGSDAVNDRTASLFARDTLKAWAYATAQTTTPSVPPGAATLPVSCWRADGDAVPSTPFTTISSGRRAAATSGTAM